MDFIGVAKRKVFEKNNVGDFIKDSVTINKKFYGNDIQGFYIYEVENDKGQIFKIKGDFEKLKVGSRYDIYGYVSGYRGKKDIRIAKIYRSKYNYNESLIDYLKGIRGIGNKAEILYRAYGEEVLSILKNKPDKILELDGIGEQTLISIKENIKF